MASTIIDRATGLSVSAALKAPCLAASSSNLTLSGEQTVDGIALTDGDRVLVNGQTLAYDNGIYLVSTSAWSRAPDMSGSDEVATGTMVAVTGGTSNSGVYWLTTSGDITLGTTNLTFAYLTFASLASLIITGALSVGGILTTAGQVAFPATQNASSNANTLDDYKEGSTTPTPTAGSGTFTSASAELRYTKIGRRVFCSAKLTVTTLGTAGGAFFIPIPFTNNSSYTGHGGGIRTSDGVGLSVYVSASASYVSMLLATGATIGQTCECSFMYDV